MVDHQVRHFEQRLVAAKVSLRIEMIFKTHLQRTIEENASPKQRVFIDRY